MMGVVLFMFSFVAGFWSFLDPPEEEKNEMASGLSTSPDETFLNPYVVAAIFAAVGASCLTIAWKKKRVYEKDPPC